MKIIRATQLERRNHQAPALHHMRWLIRWAGLWKLTASSSQKFGATSQSAPLNCNFCCHRTQLAKSFYVSPSGLWLKARSSSQSAEGRSPVPSVRVCFWEPSQRIRRCDKPRSDFRREREVGGSEYKADWCTINQTQAQRLCLID